MPLPADWDTVEVYGTYVDVNGNPASGTITFTAQTRLRSDAYETAVLPSAIAVNLDEDGSFVYDLPVTDDPDISPPGWAWLVQERFGDDTPTPYKRNYMMLAPAGDPIDLTNIAPAVPPEQAPVVPWTSVAGKTPNAEGDIVLSYGDLTGTVPGQALPALSITDVHTVADEDAMLALDAQQGDMAIRADENTTYVLAEGDPTLAASWIKLATPPDVVLSVAGKTGAVTLDRADVGLDHVDNTADIDKPVSAATQAALDARVPETRTITAGTGLTGGGDLTHDRTFDVAYGTTAGTAAEGDDPRITGAAQQTANLADLTDPATARTNLDLGDAATLDVGTIASTVAAGDDSRITGAAQQSANLSDLDDPTAARSSLGLGGAATRNVGTTAGTVAAGDDPRFEATGGGATVAADEFLPVANGTHFNGNGGSGTEGLIQARCRQSRKLLRVIDGGADTLRLEWANTYTTVLAKSGDASCENPGPNNVTVRMAVEYPAGNPRMVSGNATWKSGTAYAIGDQVNHNGASWVAVAASTGQTPSDSAAAWRRVRRYTVRWDGDDTAGTVTFAPGDYKISRDVQLAEALRYGDMIAVLGAFDSGSSTGRIPYAGANGAAKHGVFTDWVVDATGGMPAAGSALPDTGVTNQTNGNTTTANAPVASTWMKIPYATAVTGNNNDGRCVALFGDSLMAGYNDYRDGEPAGLFVRALDGAKWWRIAQGGNAAACYAPGNAPWQMSVVRRCSAVLTDLGVNDVQYGLNTATTKARMERLWRVLGSDGAVPVYATMFTPLSSSTDNWATLANQGQYTGGGTVPTTQFPGGNTSYEASVWGAVNLWLTQDGASVVTADGSTVKAGEYGHPLAAIIDDRSMFTDPETGWRWAAPGYTTDGAHPNTTASTIQGAYMVGEMDNLLNARSRVDHRSVFNPSGGQPPLYAFDRAAATTEASTIPNGSVLSVLGVSDGRYFYGIRWLTGSNRETTRHWSVLAGLDPTKMKVIASGSSGVPSNGKCDAGFASAPLWIPRGHLVAAQITTPAANSAIGTFIPNSAANLSGMGYVLASHVPTDTGQLSVGSTYSLHTSGRYSAVRFQAYIEVY